MSVQQSVDLDIDAIRLFVLLSTVYLFSEFIIRFVVYQRNLGGDFLSPLLISVSNNICRSSNTIKSQNINLKNYKKKKHVWVFQKKKFKKSFGKNCKFCVKLKQKCGLKQKYLANKQRRENLQQFVELHLHNWLHSCVKIHDATMTCSIGLRDPNSRSSETLFGSTWFNNWVKNKQNLVSKFESQGMKEMNSSVGPRNHSLLVGFSISVCVWLIKVSPHVLQISCCLDSIIKTV